MSELFKDINGKWSDGQATYRDREERWRPYANEVSDDPRESAEPQGVSSRRETGHVVRRVSVSDAARETLLHRSGDGTTGPEAVSDVSGPGVSQTRFQRFRFWLGSPRGALWYFGTAYACVVAYWAWRLI